MTFGTAARRSTAAVGRNLGDMGDRGIILLLIIFSLSLHTELYYFILKYDIYTFVCKLMYFLKFGWLLLKLILKLLSLYLPDITCKFVY